MFTAIFYDAKGRVIQTQSTNETGGTDVSTMQYNWAGQPLITVQKQIAFSQETIVVTQMTYDDLGRLVKTEKKLSNPLVQGGVMSGFNTISTNEYDKLGQHAKVNLAPNYNGTGLESQNYEYNIRGWILGMNRDYAKDYNNNNYFGFDLGYDKQFNGIIGNASYNTPQYNGNIEGMIWKSKGDAEKRKYDFKYDAANRILKADFTHYSSGSFTTHPVFNFNMQMGDGVIPGTAYDANGNIKRMQQWGAKLTSSDQIDDLKYTYYENSNRLKSVTDFRNDINTTLGDFKTKNSHPQSSSKSALSSGSSETQFDLITDYSYDTNGNLQLDNNKGISSVTYNHLNLPSVISFPNNSTITFLYDAVGNKLRKITIDNTTNNTITTTTNYIGETVYESKSTQSYDPDISTYTNLLQFVKHEEGRIRFVKANPNTCLTSQDRFIYDYLVKDHLGNVRMVLTEQREDICYIPATVEDSRYQAEQKIFDIVNARRIDKSTTGATQSSFESKLYRLHGGLTNEKTGLGAVLKVMTGDAVKITAESYYYWPGSANEETDPSLTELLTAFVGSKAVVTAHGTVSSGSVSSVGINSTSIPSWLSSHSVIGGAKAYINWILFDDQFNFVTGDFDEVQSSGGYKLHTKFINSPINISKNGYLYVFASNKSNLPVYFDNLSLTHTPGALIEESHYYPYGLIMNKISSTSFPGDNKSNKIKYNGIEIANDLDLNIYDAHFRELDGQIGRWWEIDPKIEQMESWSPYASNFDNPISNMDVLGDEPSGCCGFLTEMLERADQRLGQARDWIGDTWDQAGKNFNARWEARADPLHQIIDNPMSMMPTPVGPLGPVKGLFVAEGKLELQVATAEMKTVAQTEKSLLNGIGNGVLKSEAAKNIGKSSGLGMSGAKAETKGLGNPFKNSSLKNVDKAFQKHVKSGKLVPTPGAPGNKVYQNTKSGYSYNLDAGGKKWKKGVEKPHIDVNYPKPKPKNKPKKKHDVSGGF